MRDKEIIMNSNVIYNLKIFRTFALVDVLSICTEEASGESTTRNVRDIWDALQREVRDRAACCEELSIKSPP
eukprot:3588771-Amphidinium_carterae.1